MKMLFHPDHAENKKVELAGCTEEVQAWLKEGYLLRQPGLADAPKIQDAEEESAASGKRIDPNAPKDPHSNRINPLREPEKSKKGGTANELRQ